MVTYLSKSSNDVVQEVRRFRVFVQEPVAAHTLIEKLTDEVAYSRPNPITFIRSDHLNFHPNIDRTEKFGRVKKNQMWLWQFESLDKVYKHRPTFLKESIEASSALTPQS